MSKYVKATNCDVYINGKRISSKPIELTKEEFSAVRKGLVRLAGKISNKIEDVLETPKNNTQKDYSSMSRDELKAELKAKGIKFFPTVSDETLIKLLQK